MALSTITCIKWDSPRAPYARPAGRRRKPAFMCCATCDCPAYAVAKLELLGSVFIVPQRIRDLLFGDLLRFWGRTDLN